MNTRAEIVGGTLQRVNGESADAKRKGYFIQIGLDFGTSYCKCVCRDIRKGKAWVHCRTTLSDGILPFLMPSALQVKGDRIHVGETSTQYHKRGLPHIKMALVKVAANELDGPVLQPYREIFRRIEPEELKRFVIACGVYLLGGALGEVRASIRKRYSDFGRHPQDYTAVNLAIPVADGERPEVNNLFRTVLRRAWRFADRLTGYPSYTLSEIYKHLPGKDVGEEESESDECFIYPEVSAGVQGFVMSSTSTDGVYLFTDTGAGTVDQSLFILSRRLGADGRLVYLFASVLPLGSSHIERLAAEYSGQVGWKCLEVWRTRKENPEGLKSPELERARNKICADLVPETVALLFAAKNKLPTPDQLMGLRVLYGGGGHSPNPYMRAVLEATTDEKQVILGRPLKPITVNMPVPKDLEGIDANKAWMPRLAVAYGLSFQKDELLKYIYPKHIRTLTAEERRPRTKALPDEIGKEHC